MSISRKELRDVVDTYKFYYSRVSGKNNYIFKMTDSRAKMIENFVIAFKELNQTKLLQETALKKYMEYQFTFWYKKDAKYGKGTSIQIEWIIGDKALERWINLNKKHISYVIRKTLKTDVDLKPKPVKKDSKWNSALLELSRIEEIDKAKFLNEEGGLEYCILTTNMYNHKSPNCMLCNFSTDCKKRLKVIYPKIFEVRGY